MRSFNSRQCLALACLLLAGCGERSTPVESVAALLPDAGGRAIPTAISPGADQAGIGRAWVLHVAALTRFAPGSVPMLPDWEAALRGRRVEVVLVTVSEIADGVPSGLEAGEVVESRVIARLPGIEAASSGGLVPLFREGSKWRGAWNAAAKWEKERLSQR